MTRLVSAIAAACVLGIPALTLAAGTLDQKQELINARLGATGQGHFAGQTFTAGISGQLDQVDIAVGRFNSPGDLLVEIRATSGGFPTSTVLASETMAAGSFPSTGSTENPSVFIPVAFDPPAPSTAGTLYAVVISPLAGSSFTDSYLWGMAGSGTPNQYPDGQAVETFTGGTTWQATSNPVWDTAFRTYVTPPNAAPDCSSVIATPSTLTSTAGKFSTITLAGATDLDGDTLTFQIDSVTQDEPVTSKTDKSSPDAIAAANPNQVQVRGEADPKGDGRVYRIGYTVSDGNGGSCTGVETVSVPRKKGAIAIDSAPPSYNSFGP